MNDASTDSQIIERAFAQNAQPSVLPAPTVDEYREYLDEYEITEEQKAELLQSLWWIMITFADIGWGVDSVQQCIPPLTDFSSAAESDGLERTETSTEFNSAVTAGKDRSP